MTLQTIKCFLGLHRMESGKHIDFDGGAQWTDTCTFCHKEEIVRFMYSSDVVMKTDIRKIRELLEEPKCRQD